MGFRHTHLLSLLEPHMPRYWPGGQGEIEQGKHSAGPVVLLRKKPSGQDAQVKPGWMSIHTAHLGSSRVEVSGPIQRSFGSEPLRQPSLQYDQLQHHQDVAPQKSVA